MVTEARFANSPRSVRPNVSSELGNSYSAGEEVSWRRSQGVG